jgi:branched-chain amino acid transport system substrate-binding protein
MLSTRRALAALAVVVALAVAGCGGSAANSGGGGGGGGDGGGGQGPVRIGVVTSLSGQYSVLGQFVKNTADLMAKQVNRSGGLNGRQVQLVYRDDRTDPTEAVKAVRGLVRDRGIAALIGPIFSSSCAAVVDLVEQAKMPMVTTCATESQVNPIRQFTFMSTLSTPAQVERLLQYLEQTGRRRIALIHDTTDFGEAGGKAVKAIAGAHKVKVVREEAYSLTGSTFVSQLTAGARAGADALVVWGAGPPLVTMAKEYQQLGLEPPLVLSAAAATPLFLKPAGGAARGVVMASSLANVLPQVPGANPSKPIVQDLARSYRQAYGQPMSQFSADVCGAFRVLTAAIEKAGDDHQAIRDAIAAQPVVGCHGTYRYGPDDHHGLAPEAVWVATVKGDGLVATPFSVGQAGTG